MNFPPCEKCGGVLVVTDTRNLRSGDCRRRLECKSCAWLTTVVGERIPRRPMCQPSEDELRAWHAAYMRGEYPTLAALMAAMHIGRDRLAAMWSKLGLRPRTDRGKRSRPAAPVRERQNYPNLSAEERERQLEIEAEIRAATLRDIEIYNRRLRAIAAEDPRAAAHLRAEGLVL